MQSKRTLGCLDAWMLGGWKAKSVEYGAWSRECWAGTERYKNVSRKVAKTRREDEKRKLGRHEDSS